MVSLSLQVAIRPAILFIKQIIETQRSGKGQANERPAEHCIHRFIKTKEKIMEVMGPVAIILHYIWLGMNTPKVTIVLHITIK